MLPSFALCIAGLILGAFTLGTRRSVHLEQLLQATAARLGLTFTATRGQVRARGRIEGVDVELELAPRGIGERDDVALVSVRSAGLPRSLAIGVIDAWAVIGQLFERERVLTHDGAFDTELFAEGDEAQVTALLDQDTRRALLELVRGRGARVYLGRIELEVFHAMQAARDPAELGRVVLELVALAERLSVQGPSLSERLADNAARERHTAVRWKNLSLLLEEYPHTPAAERAARAALADPAHELRLLGASHLGEEGFDAIAALVADEHAPEEVRLRAVLVLAKQHARARVLPVLEAGLGSSSAALRVQAVIALAALGHFPEAQRARLEELVASADPRAIRAVAHLLEAPDFAGLGAAEGFEPLFVALLGQGSAVALVAIEVLARIGSVRAVEPLLALAGRVLVDGALKQAARDAVAAIQARVRGADRGELSLASEAAGDGAVSVAADEGALSFPVKR